jgi:hypothetical protein
MAAGGPHDAEQTIAAAWLAAETVRYLNYATSSDQGVEFASTLYSVAGALSIAAGRIPQLIAQIRTWLEVNSGRLHNDGTAVSDTLDAAGASSRSAADAAALLALHLGELQAALTLTATRNPPAAGETHG